MAMTCDHSAIVTWSQVDCGELRAAFSASSGMRRVPETLRDQLDCLV